MSTQDVMQAILDGTLKRASSEMVAVSKVVEASEILKKAGFEAESLEVLSVLSSDDIEVDMGDL